MKKKKVNVFVIVKTCKLTSRDFPVTVSRYYKEFYVNSFFPGPP